MSRPAALLCAAGLALGCAAYANDLFDDGCQSRINFDEQLNTYQPFAKVAAHLQKEGFVTGEVTVARLTLWGQGAWHEMNAMVAPRGSIRLYPYYCMISHYFSASVGEYDQPLTWDALRAWHEARSAEVKSAGRPLAGPPLAAKPNLAFKDISSPTAPLAIFSGAPGWPADIQWVTNEAGEPIGDYFIARWSAGWFLAVMRRGIVGGDENNQVLAWRRVAGWPLTKNELVPTIDGWWRLSATPEDDPEVGYEVQYTLVVDRSTIEILPGRTTHHFFLSQFVHRGHDIGVKLASGKLTGDTYRTPSCWP